MAFASYGKRTPRNEVSPWAGRVSSTTLWILLSLNSGVGKWSKRGPTAKKVNNLHPFQPVNISRYRGNWIFINFSYDHFGNEIAPREQLHVSRDDQEDADEDIAHTPSSQISSPKLLNVLSDLSSGNWTNPSFLSVPGSMNSHLREFSSVEGNLFDYFVAAISPSCSFSSSQNPYLTLIAPMSLDCTPLKSAVLAVSANQLRLLNDKRFEKEALYHKSMALSGVQKAIDSGQVEWGVIATVLMLCFYDVQYTIQAY